jgi:hypothetical protein
VLLQVNPESLLMLHGHAADEAGSGDAGLFLHAGLSNGVMTRTEVDRITGGREHTLPLLQHLAPNHCTIKVQWLNLCSMCAGMSGAAETGYV